MARAQLRRVNTKRGVRLAIAAVLWWWPPPEGLTLEAWRLFVIVAAAIGAVVPNAVPLLTASVLAVAAAVLGRVLTPEQAYAGFANGTILLIVLAFLVARSVITSGLGVRIGHLWSGASAVRPSGCRTHLLRRRADRPRFKQHRAVGRPTRWRCRWQMRPAPP